MDLEEELTLSNQEAPLDFQANSISNDGRDDDLLGLDKQIKLTTRAKIAKIDNERIFEKQKGLNYIIKNHHKVSKSIKRNDKTLAKKLSQNPQYSSAKKRQAKFDNEFENLSSVLQFYQLWCHGIFPKARFKDCLHLVRVLGSKSSQLKLYRRDLLDIEIRKLKVKNGLLDEDETFNRVSVDDDNGQTENADNTEGPQTENNVDDNDDWSFMNVNNQTNNALFVGEEEDENSLYRTSNKDIEQINEHSNENPLLENTTVSNKISHSHEPPISEKTNETNITNNASDSEDPFSDDDDLLPSQTQTQASNKQTTADPSEMFFDANDKEEEYENEMEVMREMGL